jgi:hypothetical protein
VKARILEPKEHLSPAGTLRVIELGLEIGVAFNRFFSVHGVAGAKAGGHGHKECHQIMFMMSGSANVSVHESETTRSKFTLTNNGALLWIPPLNYVTYEFIDEVSSLGVFASHAYDPKDYFYDVGELESFPR